MRSGGPQGFDLTAKFNVRRSGDEARQRDTAGGGIKSVREDAVLYVGICAPRLSWM